MVLCTNLVPTTTIILYLYKFHVFVCQLLYAFSILPVLNARIDGYPVLSVQHQRKAFTGHIDIVYTISVVHYTQYIVIIKNCFLKYDIF